MFNSPYKRCKAAVLSSRKVPMHAFQQQQHCTHVRLTTQPQQKPQIWSKTRPACQSEGDDGVALAQRDSSVLFCAIAGPLSQTHRELWAALSRTQLPGNITAPATIQAEAALNNRTTALLASLLAQSSSSSSSSGTELGIANGIWTKQLPVLKGYADDMWRLYRVSMKWPGFSLGTCTLELVSHQRHAAYYDVSVLQGESLSLLLCAESAM
jgi:hypothetical protein